MVPVLHYYILYFVHTNDLFTKIKLHYYILYFVRHSFFLYLTNREASTVLFSVVKHARGG